MSRNITANHTAFSTEAGQEERAAEGKLLFTKYCSQDCAMLIKGTRLIAMQSLAEDSGLIGAVYVGRVQNVAQNLDACFVEIADGNAGFLSERDSRYYFLCSRADGAHTGGMEVENDSNSTAESGHRKRKYRFRQGDELLVQVTKEPHKTKQIALSTHISLSCEAAVISLGAAKIGYSAKLSEEKKQEIKDWLKEAGLREEGRFLFEKIWQEAWESGFGPGNAIQNSSVAQRSNVPVCPADISVVVRTQAQTLDRDSFLKELTALAKEFALLLQRAPHRTRFSCLKAAPPAFAAAMDRLAYPSEYQEIVTDDRKLYGQMTDYCKIHCPNAKIRYYEDSMLSLFKLYSMDKKTETAFNTHVWLKSGGYLVIQPTEALTVIDVNSGKSESKKGAFLLNCEAAEEVALQIRLRNLSGIIIVDFINMEDWRQREDLLAYLRTLTRRDRQRTNVVDMTPLGLVEITRKRESRTLREQFAKERNP